ERVGSKLEVPPLGDRVAERAFLFDRLPAVAASGHRLPVASIPEEAHVALVCDPVIHHVGELAASAGAMAVLWTCEECLALALPLTVIAACSGRGPASVGRSLEGRSADRTTTALIRRVPSRAVLRCGPGHRISPCP